ncbi:acetylcholine receptor subunit beta-like 1 [Mizuhopecten yessoensis]|uniref:Neuronal acetylcholine receptor subunit alpha-10 n=1 Tax=Mizuhopecten yessoensis TaxID=6573 RepID=A0A210QTG4_MIZYE|nr:acetylcholine receptor subunit beta-like 1 [Mizuhopecten yessoensis]OWF52031.1 Neuronal acetylcholine receptor subunit alpha-10 [Mizuhopecten yessoensis]
MASIILGYVTVLVLPMLVSCQTSDDVKSLLHSVFNTNAYNKWVRPSANQTTRTDVTLDFYPVGIIAVDEVNGKMSTIAYLFITWNDNYITWSPDSFGGITKLYIPQNYIWKPDIALNNGYTKMKELGDAFILTVVRHDGEVEWKPYEIFQTKCIIDISNFPFDKQTCNVTFGVWSSFINDVDLNFQLGKNTIGLDTYQNNTEWDIISTATDSRDSFADGASVTFSLTIRRRPEYYMYHIVAPVMLLSILAVFTFALPVESGEKMGFCMTVYLAFAVFLTLVSESLPVSSTQSLLSRYLLVLVLMGTAIVMVTTIELRINYRDTAFCRIPLLLKGLVHISRKIQCQHRGKVSDEQQTEQHDSPQDIQKRGIKEPAEECDGHGNVSEGMTWSDVTSAIDLFCFWMFLATNIIATSVIFGSGYQQSKT